MKLADLAFDTRRRTDKTGSDKTGSDKTGSDKTQTAVATSLAAGEGLLSRFSGVVAVQGAATAVVDEDGRYSFDALEAAANRIAHTLLTLKLPHGSRVGVMAGRNRHFIAAELAVMKAGLVALPLDPTLPLERRRLLLDLAQAPALLADTANVGAMRRLQWECPALTHTLCLDADNIDAVIETAGAMMSAEMWDHLAGDQADDVGAGGWKSPFTGEPIGDAGMTAFGLNARRKVEPLLRAGGHVLEVGCASGFTMRQIAPLATSYTATDLSRRNAERVEANARKLGLHQVTGRHLAAHDIDVLPPGHYDLIVFNSVIENFPGYGYLRAVLDKAVGLLRPGGAILLGSLWDLRRRAQYLDDLGQFAADHGDEGYNTRLEVAEALFVPADFARDWAASRAERPSVAVSDVVAADFDPAPYLIDAVVTFDGRGDGVGEPARTRLDRRALDAQPSTAPAVTVAADDAALTLFVGGTDGLPQPVILTHGGIAATAQALGGEVLKGDGLQGGGAQGGGLAVGCVFSFGFEGGVVQSFAPLLNGHALYLPSEETKSEPKRLHAFMVDHRLDVCDATPGVLAMLADVWQDEGGGSPVKHFVVSGEPLPAELARRFFERPGHRDHVLTTLYGPAEAGGAALRWRMTATSWQEYVPLPAGTPLPGVTTRICDAAGRDLPAGVPGELWIGGPGLAFGQGAWLRTGDIARTLRDGVIRLAGRDDRRVIIRGCRVEPAEVEMVLARHPLIDDAAVVAVESRSGPVLAAYVVALPGFEVGRCRTALEATLPSWLLPSWLLTVDELPRRDDGTVDAAALPNPAALEAAHHQDRAAVPLTTDTQRRLAKLWEDILDITVEDAEDDFFGLGGHSVLAVRLVAAVDAAFGVRLPLSELFTFPTLTRMAERIDAQNRGSDWHPVVGVNTAGTRTPLICFHPVGGNILCYKDLAEVLGADQPVYMIQSYGLEGDTPLLPTVEAMVDNYLKAMKGNIPEGPVSLAGWSFGGLLAWEAARRLEQAGVEVKAVVLMDTVATPDFARDLLQKDEADYLATLFDVMGLGDAEAFRRLTPEQRLDMILEHGKGGHFFPDNMKRADMRRLLNLFQNNALAALRYKAGPRDGTMLLVRPRVPSLQAPSLPGDDYSGWRPLARGGVDLRWMDGDHGHMLYQPYLNELADHIRHHLDEVGA